jgi:hypothetical protein
MRKTMAQQDLCPQCGKPPVETKACSGCVEMLRTQSSTYRTALRRIYTQLETDKRSAWIVMKEIKARAEQALLEAQL